jgi:dinuclear metal center YbgI/SA1388 family protein
MKIKEVCSFLEEVAPLALQEDYDNAGLQCGEESQEVDGILVCVDVTDEVIEEAIKKSCNLIVSHHPVIFKGLKKITGRSMAERIVFKAIQHSIAIYSAHTNLDAVTWGVNKKIADVMELEGGKILSPVKNHLRKLVTFVPHEHAENVRNALFGGGAGHIGDYDHCSYNLEGKGTFRPLEGTNPFSGVQGETHFEPEARIETVYPVHLEKHIINAMKQAHPYEEVAYDIFPLNNDYKKAGMGMVGNLKSEMSELDFLNFLKEKFSTGLIRHTGLLGKTIRRVALCGGSGSFLLNSAIQANADVFVSGDFKYHQFFEADQKILIADIGHYESEQFTKDIFYEQLTKKFPNFAVHFSEINTNPIKYF